MYGQAKEAKEEATPMLQLTNPQQNGENSTHDHTDTIFPAGKGLFWKDMCPIQPV